MGVEAQPGACSLWIALSFSATAFARVVLPTMRVSNGHEQEENVREEA